MKLNQIIDRARELLLRPKDEWIKIAEENDEPQRMITFIAILGIVPALALFIGYGIIGLPTMYGFFKLSLMSAFFAAIVFYFLTGVGIALTAMMVGFFCHYFSIEGRWQQYLKIAVYASVAPILANIFYLLPVLKFLRIIGFYGCVTLFVGLPIILKIPKDKEMQFVVTILVGAIIIAFIFLGLTDQFLGPIYSDIL